MKKLIFALGITALSTIASTYAAETVDFKAVNPVLQALVDATVAADQNVESAYPTFDEKVCDLKAERLKYDLTATVKNTPWVDGGRAEITGTSTYAADWTTGHTGVAVTMSVTAKTDTLSLIRYSANLALKKRQSTNPKYDPRIDSHLKRLAVARSFTEVDELLRSGHQIARDMIADDVERAEKYLACVKAGGCTYPGETEAEKQQEVEYAADVVARDKRMQKSIGDVKFVSVKTGQEITSVTLVSDSINDMIASEREPLKIGTTTLTFNAESLGMGNQSFYSMKPQALKDLKADFEKRLLGVQNGNPEDKDYVQGRFREALIEYKRAIHAEIIH